MRQSLNLGPHPLGENKYQNAVPLIKGRNCFRYHHYKQNYTLKSAQSRACKKAPSCSSAYPTSVQIPVLCTSWQQCNKTQSIFLGEMNVAAKHYCWIRERNVDFFSPE